MKKELQLVVLWVLLLIVIHVVTPNMYYYFQWYTNRYENIFTLSTINQFIILLFGVGIVRRKGNSYVNKKQLSISCGLIGILQGIVIYIGIRVFKDAMSWLYFGIFNHVMMYRGVGGVSYIEIFYLVLLVAIVPAYCEEFFYRKAIIDNINNRKKGVVLSILLFTGAHFMVGKEAMIGAFFLGFVLAIQYSKYQLFVLVFIEHFTYNLLEIIFTYVIRFPTDIYYISQCASSDGECIGWGLFFIEIVIVCIIVFGALEKIQKGRLLNEK